MIAIKFKERTWSMRKLETGVLICASVHATTSITVLTLLCGTLWSGVSKLATCAH